MLLAGFMKTLFLILALTLVSVPVLSQVIRIYGYEQPVSGGAQKEQLIVPGKEERPVTGNSRYFVFAEVKKGERIMIKDVWIKRNSFSFKSDTVKRLPYVLQNPNGGELNFRDTLVRSAVGNVVQLSALSRIDNVQMPPGIKNKVISNEVVIVFLYRKKTLTAVLKKIKRVTPLFTQ